MSTLLQLVNRVLRKHRHGDIVGFTTREGIHMRDIVNEAVRDVLETRVWEFDVREDGVLQTVATDSATGTLLAINGNTDQTIASWGSTNTAAGDFVTRLLVTDDPNFANDAYRVKNAVLVSGFNTFTLDSAFLGSSNLGADWKTFVSEYALPANVRAVVEVRHQGTPLQLQWVNKHMSFSKHNVRPHDNISDSPTRVYWGFQITPTSSTSTESDKRVGIMIDPIPETVYRLDYSYVESRSDMSLATDQLVGVPAAVEDVIVDLAYAKSHLTGFGNDAQKGMLMEKRSRAVALALWKQLHKSSGRRNRIRSLDSAGGASGANFGRLPSNYGSL